MRAALLALLHLGYDDEPAGENAPYSDWTTTVLEHGKRGDNLRADPEALPDGDRTCWRRGGALRWRDGARCRQEQEKGRCNLLHGRDVAWRTIARKVCAS